MRIAIIGGGFSGLIFASKMLDAGVDATLFEEHQMVGYPPHCTGLISSRVLGMIGDIAFKSVIIKFDEIILSNYRSYIKLKVKDGIFKIDRVKLERLMLEKAISKGLKTRLGVRVKRVSPKGIIEAGDLHVFDVIVLADGYYGFLHRSLGIGYLSPPIYGVNVEYQEKPVESNVIVLFDDMISKGLFSWIVGLGDRVLAGLGVKNPSMLARSLRILETRLGLRKRITAYGGPVIVGPPARILSLGKIHVVGDAGGLNKPLTGGGLYPNSLAASLASKMIAKGYDVNNSLEKAISMVAEMLRKQYKLARLVLESGAASTAIEKAAETEIYRDIGEVDYDHHEQILRKMLEKTPIKTLRIGMGTILKKPATIKYAIRLLSLT